MNAAQLMKFMGLMLALHGVMIAVFPGATVRVALQLVIFLVIITLFFLKNDLWGSIFSGLITPLYAFIFYGLLLTFRGIINSDSYEKARFVAVDFFPFVALPIFWIIGSRALTLVVMLKYIFIYCTLFSFIYIVKGPVDKHNNLQYIVYSSYVLPLLVSVSILPNKVKCILLIVASTSLFFDMSNRTNVSGIIGSLVIGVWCSFIVGSKSQNAKAISYFAIKAIRLILMSAPILLCFAALLFNYNVFEEIGGIDTEQVRDSNFTSIDSRTGLYVDAYQHMLATGDWIFGSSPSVMFQTTLADYSDDYKDGRLGGFEAAILSIFVFGGLINIFIVFLIFWHASYLAIFHSESWVLKFIGLYLTVRWVYCFIENPIGFNIYWASTFLFIGVCFSPEIRRMSDKEIKNLIIDCRVI